MKKIITAFAATLLFVSCKKEQLESKLPERVAFAPAPVTVTNIIPTNISHVVTTAGGETVTYTDGSVATFTGGLGKINVSIKRNGKTDLITGTDITFMGIRTVKLYTGGKMYHSFSINAAGQLKSIFIDDKYYPFVNIYPTLGDRVTYDQCMKAYINKCGSSFWCTITFGTTIFGVASAGIGWSFGCLLGVKP